MTDNFVTAIITEWEGWTILFSPQEQHCGESEAAYFETSLSLDVAGRLLPAEDGHIPHLEIHLDVGEMGDTKELIRKWWEWLSAAVLMLASNLIHMGQPKLPTGINNFFEEEKKYKIQKILITLTFSDITGKIQSLRLFPFVLRLPLR